MAKVQFPTTNWNHIHKGGMCKGYSLAWLGKCKVKIPASADEMPSRSEASFKMLQYDWLFEDHQYAESAKSPNLAVLPTTRAKLVSKGKHGKKLFAAKSKKFQKTAKLVGGTVGAGYLIETKEHAMAVVNSGGHVVFFDANFGQYEPMSGADFLSFYPSHVKKHYSTALSEYYRLF